MIFDSVFFFCLDRACSCHFMCVCVCCLGACCSTFPVGCPSYALVQMQCTRQPLQLLSVKCFCQTFCFECFRTVVYHHFWGSWVFPNCNSFYTSRYVGFTWLVAMHVSLFTTKIACRGFLKTRRHARNQPSKDHGHTHLLKVSRACPGWNIYSCWWGNRCSDQKQQIQATRAKTREKPNV